MGCVHTRQGMLAIGDGVVQVTYEVLWNLKKKDNQKAKKINYIINQVLALGPKHNKIRA
jgi:hypothetical protein